MGKTKIEWTESTWNPVTGCTKLSPGCAHCYAERMAKRFAGRFGYPADDPFRLTLHPDKLAAPLRWKKPRMIFVGSMGDLFHEDVPDAFIDRVFTVMALCPQHTFQVLTKRPERMANYLQKQWEGAGRSHLTAWGVWCSQMATEACNRGFRDYHATDEDELSTDDIYDELIRATYRGYLQNVWLGTSIENQETADERIPHLLDCPAAVRFVSAEPLLGPLNLEPYLPPSWSCMACGYEGNDSKEFCSSCRKPFPSADSAGKDVPCDCGCIHYECGCPECEAIEEFGTWGNEAPGCKCAPRLDWVIVGGESGPGARPMKPDWVRSIRDQCQAGVPWFFKQWGAWMPGEDAGEMHGKKALWVCRCGVTTEVLDDDTKCKCHDLYDQDWQRMVPVGKKAAGRLLDGREWNEYPEATDAAGDE